MKEFDELPKQIQYMINIRMREQGNGNTAKYNRSRDYGGFDWKDTPEGFNFWKKIVNHDQYANFFKLYPYLESKEFSSEMKDTSLICIDYTDPYWWKILEKGDEIIVVDSIDNNVNKKKWSCLKEGTILKVTESDIKAIEAKEKIICFNDNHCMVNFTYNMVRLHKKNLNNNKNDVSKLSDTIQQGVGSTGLNFSSGECKIAIGSRLVGTTTRIGPSETSVKSGVLMSFQHI